MNRKIKTEDLSLTSFIEKLKPTKREVFVLVDRRYGSLGIFSNYKKVKTVFDKFNGDWDGCDGVWELSIRKVKVR